MNPANTGSRELETLQDMFIFSLLKASVPQQTVRKIVKVIPVPNS
jgi:hypothetical protein